MRKKQNDMTYFKAAEQILKIADTPLTEKQIWKRIVEKNLMQSSGKTPWQSLSARLYVDIKKGNSIFCIASKRPTTFWLKEYKNKLEISSLQAKIEKEQEKEKQIKPKFSERDLHPLLVKFVYESEFYAYSKTIFHEQSSKSTSGRDRWMYPDVVSVHFPFSDDYKEETLNFLSTANELKCKLYSFELKIALDFGNLKEYYFQAVSNSSWANEGYLVVYKDIDDEILTELRRLNASFGIGLIQLDNEIEKCKIILSAKAKELDINTLDLLVEKNPNFKNFIKHARDDLKENRKERIQKNNYDKVLESIEFDKYLKDKNITKD